MSSLPLLFGSDGEVGCFAGFVFVDVVICLSVGVVLGLFSSCAEFLRDAAEVHLLSCDVGVGVSASLESVPGDIGLSLFLIYFFFIHA